MSVTPQQKSGNVHHRKVVAVDATDTLLQRDLIYICVLLAGKKSSALVNTGSDFSLICLNELSEAWEILVRPCTAPACAITKNQIKIGGEAYTGINDLLDCDEHCRRFIVISGMVTRVIL